MRQLDAEPARGAENGLAVADVDVAAVDAEGLAGRGAAGTCGFVGGRGVRHAGPACAVSRAAGRAFLIVAVADRFLSVAIAHLQALLAQFSLSPMSERLRQIIRKIF